MVALVMLVGILLGVIGVLVGLVMIAPQVQVHAIEPYSAGSWVFRVGVLLSLIGLVLMLGSGRIDVLRTLGLITGGTAILGGLFVLNHEREQALHAGAERWDILRSLTTQMMGSGVLIVIVTLLS